LHSEALVFGSTIGWFRSQNGALSLKPQRLRSARFGREFEFDLNPCVARRAARRQNVCSLRTYVSSPPFRLSGQSLWIRPTKGDLEADHVSDRVPPLDQQIVRVGALMCAIGVGGKNGVSLYYHVNRQTIRECSNAQGMECPLMGSIALAAVVLTTNPESDAPNGAA